jgi:hypothetical protein
MTPSPHPKVQAAYERYARLLETMHRANGWGETRRFAGRSAGLRLERIEKATGTAVTEVTRCSTVSTKSERPNGAMAC